MKTIYIRKENSNKIREISYQETDNGHFKITTSKGKIYFLTKEDFEKLEKVDVGHIHGHGSF